MSVPDRSVVTFRRDAGAFCEFVDGFRLGTVSEPYTRLLKLLSDLVQSAVAIPFDIAKGDVDGPCLSHEQWTSIAAEIAAALAPAMQAIAVEHADDMESLVRASMLWDDLADIYRELRHGLDLYAIGDPDHCAEAVWQWRFGYENHWGQHLFRALTTVHEIRYLLRLE